MIEISTHTPNSLQHETAQNSISAENLSEEDQFFYTSIKKNLNEIIESPRTETISRILNYSRSM
jgi:hypothetical protein